VSEGRFVPWTIIYLDCRAFCLDNRVIWFDYVFVLMLDIKYYYQQAGFMQSFCTSHGLIIGKQLYCLQLRLKKYSFRYDMIYDAILTEK
jgi:hypothetical protein